MPALEEVEFYVGESQFDQKQIAWVKKLNSKIKTSVKLQGAVGERSQVLKTFWLIP